MLKILIDTGGADFLFDWNPIVVLLCGIVIDIILFVLSYYLNGEGNNKRIALAPPFKTWKTSWQMVSSRDVLPVFCLANNRSSRNSHTCFSKAISASSSCSSVS